MQCPQGHGPLAIAERQGVEIDYCPQCRGIWLDRGEIDKIIEREMAAYGPYPSPQQAAQSPEPFLPDERMVYRQDEERCYYRDDRRYEDGDDRRYERDDYRDDRHRGKRKKRGSFLSELLDL